MNALLALARGIDWLNDRIGRLLAWLIIAMVLVTFGVVVARYLFNEGSIAVQESIMYMHSLVFLGAAGYALRHDQHVRVDVFYNRMPPRGKALVDLLGSLLLLLPVFFFILYVSTPYVMGSWELLEGSPEAGGLPLVYLLKTFILLMAVTMLAQGFSLGVHSLARLLGREADTHENNANRI